MKVTLTIPNHKQAAAPPNETKQRSNEKTSLHSSLTTLTQRLLIHCAFTFTLWPFCGNNSSSLGSLALLICIFVISAEWLCFRLHQNSAEPHNTALVPQSQKPTLVHLFKFNLLAQRKVGSFARHIQYT